MLLHLGASVGGEEFDKSDTACFGIRVLHVAVRVEIFSSVTLGPVMV